MMNFYDGNGNIIDISQVVGGDIEVLKKAIDFNIVKGENGILPTFCETEGQYHLEGRWYKKVISSNNYDVTNNSGSMIFFKISGATTVSVNWYRMVDDIMIYWSYCIDGGELVRKEISDNTITLPDTNEHIVMIICDGIEENIGKWSEGNGYAFSGLESSGTLTAIIPTNKKILFFGDSITEGIRTLGIPSGSSASETNSATHAYAWYTAKWLYAIPLFCGYGASGVGLNGSFSKLENAIKYLYNGNTVPDELMKPDMIVINMGQNDKTYGTDTEQFVTDYRKCIELLSIKYSGVPIVCMIPFTQNYGAYVRNAVSGIPYCTVVETSGWNPKTAEGIHPVDEGSMTIASKLVPELQKVVRNWF